MTRSSISEGPHADEWLWRSVPASASYGLAAALALGLILYLFPLQFLSGQGFFFENGDAAQHVSGWLFFEQDSWHFPLLKTERLNYPEGISIAFTDSIPLLALPMKLLSGVLPDGFHYFGLWHAVSYLLQALAAVFLIRALGIRHLPGAFIASAFALIWPALTYRLGHTALLTQGLLLIALGIYLRGCSGQSSARRSCLGLTLLSAAALLVHPYFLAMIYPVLLAFLAKQWHERALVARQVIGWVGGSLALLLLILVSGGYFIGKGIAIGGYDIYSLNLLAPVCGGIFCDLANGTGGQGFEGFNYFGAGLLLLMLIALLLNPEAFVSAISRHRFLFIVLLMLTLYSLSNRVYLGNWEIFNIDLPGLLKGMTGIFRVSGRFFWLVGYCVLFFVLALLLRRRSQAVLTLMVLALWLQWYDTQGLRDWMITQTQRPAAIDLPAWAAALDGVQQLDLYPVFGCESTEDEEYARFQSIAARLGLRINTGYTARKTPECAAKSRFVEQAAQPGHLYIRPGFGSQPLDVPPLYRRAMKAGDCLMDGQNLICQPDVDTQRWASLAVPLNLVRAPSHQHWSAAQLPSIIGQLKDGRRVPRQPGISGYLSYGPYISLPAGIYQFRIDYQSDAPEGIAVGHWDVVGRDAQKNAQTLASGPLNGSKGQPQPVTGAFSHAQTMTDIEIRLFSTGGDVQLSSITISNEVDGLPVRNALTVGARQ
jgi:hypothetical protein